MPYNHPYKDNDQNRHDDADKRQDPHYTGGSELDLDEVIGSAVRFGSNVGSTVLSSIAGALASVGDSFAAAGDKTRGKGKITFAQWRNRLERKIGNEGQGGALAMAIVGWIFAFSFGVAALVMGILWAVGPVPLGLGDEFVVFPILTACFTPLTLGFGFMGWKGIGNFRYFSRLRRYLRVARDWVCELPQLAQDAMVSPKQLRKDLVRAMSSGHYPGAMLARDEDMLYLDDGLYNPQPAEQPAPTQTPGETPAQIFQREGVDFLNYLRICRGKLPAADEELAAMQKTCGAIMGFIHNHPEQLPRVRRFQEYYLPTTRKLLDTAQGLGEAEVDNAQAIKRDIAGILHTLNLAYTKLYDTLLQDVSMDVSAEIDTLEAMLNQDGLTNDFTSDFGNAPKPHLQ